MTEINGRNYRSKKHPVLEYIFQKYFDPAEPEAAIIFYLEDISEGYKSVGLPEPASISNTILDLCRRDSGIDARVPKSISELGFDLRKKTGPDHTGRNRAGEFVFVGAGGSVSSWLHWDPNPRRITINSTQLQSMVRTLIGKDEAALFSVIDYLDVLSRVLGGSLFRIQNPMKWQPNEIDGFYAATIAGETIIYPVEAKALSTGDSINMDQMEGGFLTTIDKLRQIGLNAKVQQIAVKMIPNGIDIAIFPANLAPVEPEEFVRVTFDPEIENWR